MTNEIVPAGQGDLDREKIFMPAKVGAIDNYFVEVNLDTKKASVPLSAPMERLTSYGCPRVMVNQGTLAPEVRETATATLKTIVEYGKSRKVFVTAENRGGGGRRPPHAPGVTPRPPQATWEVLVEVLKKAGAYANPDIGNFPDEASRAAGLRAMYPLSSGSSHAHYAPDRYNEAAAIQISKEVGYKGLFSVEAGRNNGPDPYAAVQSIVNELVMN